MHVVFHDLCAKDSDRWNPEKLMSCMIKGGSGALVVKLETTLQTRTRSTYVAMTFLGNAVFL